VHLGGGLAGVWSQDASGVLDQAALERNRCSQEQGVEDGAVEAFTDVRASGDDQQGRATRGGAQPGERGGAGFGAHPAA
jgi:hypothetical protein